MKKSILLIISLWVSTSAVLLAQLALESDINTLPESSVIHSFLTDGDRIFFVANDNEHGSEVWRYDILSGNLKRITDIRPYALSSNPEGLTVFRDRLFFSTVASSVGRYYDINQDNLSQVNGGPEEIRQIFEFNNQIYMVASSSSNNSRLYTYDYAMNEAELIYDHDPDVRFESISNFYVHNDIIYFTASGVYHIYNPDDNTSMPLTDIAPAFTSASAGMFTEFKGKLYCRGELDPSSGRELISYDPTSGEAELIPVANNTGTHSDPSFLTIINDKLYLSAGPSAFRSMYSYDGENIERIDTDNTIDIAHPQYAGHSGDVMYIVGLSDLYGQEFYTYNVVTNEVELILDLYEGEEYGIGHFIFIDNILYCSGNRSDIGYEFFKYTLGDTEEVLIKDINPTTDSSNPSFLVPYNGKLYVMARSNLSAQGLLYTYDPVTGIVEPIIDPETQDYISRPEINMVFNDELFIEVNFPEFGKELARYNDSTGELILVHDANEGINSGSINNLTEFKGKLYFTGRNDDAEHFLFSYNPVDHVVEVVIEDEVRRLYSISNQLVAVIDRPELGDELYLINELTGEAELINEFNEGESGADIFWMIEYAGRLYFKASDGSDTYLRAYNPGSGEIETIINEDSERSIFSYPAVYNDELYFVDRADVGAELYRYSSAEPEIKLVSDIFEGSNSSSPQELNVFNDKLYFTVQIPEYGRELWEYDAQVDQAQIVSDIWAGPSNSDIRSIALFNDKLYFSANDGEHGAEIWSLASCLNSFLTATPETQGQTDGTIDLTVTGGVEPYEILWDNGAETEDLTDLSSGDYSVTIRDQSGCISVLTGTVDFISGVNDALSQEIKLYPSINSGQFILQYEHATAYDIVDLSGKIWQSSFLVDQNIQGNNYQNDINIDYISSGMYLLRLYTSEGVGVMKFIIR